MIRDLKTILDGWAYEPGKISVRKIIGREGREKIQTRIDLGVMQMECTGRPDGQRPQGFESLLDYHEQRLRAHVETHGDDEDFLVSADDCRALRHEAYLYYQRYLSLFVLEEFAGVERDTARNLRVIDLCARYGAAPDDRTVLVPQRPYVYMMNMRGRTHAALAQGRPGVALRLVDEAIANLDALSAEPDAPVCETELGTLHALRDEVLESMPLDAPARLKSELELALQTENYERAAQIRDQLTRCPATGDGG